MGVGEQIIGELSVRRLGLAACSLEIVDMSEDTQSTTTFPPCDTLILKAVFSEVEPLSDQCANLEILCKKRCHAFLGSYYDLGTVGTESVVAVRPRGMGPLGFGRSAELASRFQKATGATSVIQLGMAFGVDESKQRIGDVLVSMDVTILRTFECTVSTEQSF